MLNIICILADYLEINDLAKERLLYWHYSYDCNAVGEPSLSVPAYRLNFVMIYFDKQA
jgi:hypothetical protein